MTLTGITWDHSRGYKPLIASSALYEKLFDVKVKWEKRLLTNFGDKSLKELADKFDLLIIKHPHAGVAFETKCVFPLNELLPKEKITDLKKNNVLQNAKPKPDDYNEKLTTICILQLILRNYLFA